MISERKTLKQLAEMTADEKTLMTTAVDTLRGAGSIN